MTTLFISYARDDIESARGLYRALKRKGFTVWLDQEDLAPGARWKPAIQNQIKTCTYFLALLSTRSVNKRGYVQKELRAALDILDECPEQDVFIIPLRLDNCVPSHTALRDLNWLDLFPSFEESLDKLVSFLRERDNESINDSAAEDSSAAKLAEPPSMVPATAVQQPHPPGHWPSAGSVADPMSLSIRLARTSWSWGLCQDYSMAGDDTNMLKLGFEFSAENAGASVSLVKYRIDLFVDSQEGSCEYHLARRSAGERLVFEMLVVDDNLDEQTGSSICTLLTKRPAGVLEVWDDHGRRESCEFTLPHELTKEYGNQQYSFYTDM